MPIDEKKRYISVRESLLQAALEFKSKVGASLPNLVNYKSWLVKEKDRVSESTTLTGDTVLVKLASIEAEIERTQQLITMMARVDAEMLEVQRFVVSRRD